MTPIVFEHIERMSKKKTSAAGRNGVAQAVLDAQGVAGLVTLWACQDLYKSFTRLKEPATPASQWWLDSNNSYAHAVIKKLSKLSQSESLKLLHDATRPPCLSIDLLVNKSSHAALFAPKERKDFSNASASTVRQLARVFFPQYPELTEPQCMLYRAVADYNNWGKDIYTLRAVHGETLRAFSDDSQALQYLLRVHEDPDVSREYVTPEMERLLSHTDAEWTLFDSMGISAEEAYNLVKNPVIETSMTLPNEFNA